MFLSTWLRPLLFVSAAIALAGCGGAQSRYASHMERGKEYFAAGNFDKAGVEFRNALQIQPKAPEALHLSGRVAERRGELRQAFGLYQAATDADYLPAREDLGRVFLLGGEPERALKLVDPALAQHPDEPGLLAVRGAARFQLKDRAGARADAERAVQLAPGNENAIALLTGIYREAGDNASAMTLINKSLEKLPDSVDLRTILATLYDGAGDIEGVQDQLRKIVQLRPRELSHRLQLALFQSRQKKNDEAQRVLEEAVKSLQGNNDAKLALVNFLAAQRSREQGEKTLRAYIAREPENYDLRLGLATLLERAGAQKDAIKELDEIVRRDEKGPTGLVARNRIAAIKVASRDYDGARKLIDEVLARNPRDIEALTLRGNIALERNDPSSAITDLRAVLRDQPNAVPVQRSLAKAHMTIGEPALAEQALRSAMDSAPDNTQVRVDLAQVLTQTGRVDQAIPLLEQAVRSEPNLLSAREALTRAYLAKEDFASAQRAADDIKTLQPNAPVGYYLAGLSALGLRKLDETQKEFEHALQLQPLAVDVLTTLVQVHLQQGHPDQAIARVQRSIDQNPKNVLMINLLGEVYLAAGDAARATETLTRVTQMAPGLWIAYRDLALARIASKDVPSAIAAYEAGTKVAPGAVDLVTGLAGLYEQQGRIDDAIARYEALYARHQGSSPERRLAANNLAMLLVTYRKEPKDLDRARELAAPFANSEVGSLLDTHGWVSFKRGEYQSALSTLKRAAEREPDSHLIRYHLGMAQLRSGLREEARTSLESALKGSSSFAGAEDARAALATLRGTG